MFDVITPIQSYLSSVVGGVEVFTSKSSISKFLALEPTFGLTGLRDTYSPWDELDKFGRNDINDVINGVTSKGPKVSTEDTAGANKASTSFIVPKPGKRRSHLILDEELNKSAERLHASLDKP